MSRPPGVAEAAAGARIASPNPALHTLLQAVSAQPWSFDYFAVLRRIEAQCPQFPRWGEAQRPQQEALRLAQRPELDFAPAALSGLDWDGAAPRLAVRFFGLLGPQGPMPLHLTEFVRDRAHNHGDASPARFLDLFHHRMLGLFYRAWAQAQPVVQRDRPGEDRYAAWLGALVGLPADALKASAAEVSGPARRHVPATAQLFQAGLLASRSRHPEGLAKILTQYFKVPVAVRCHVPHWLRIEAEDHSHLGHARNRARRNAPGAACLGRNTTLGSRVWDRQYKFRIELGPLTMAQYQAFLPGSSAWQRLIEWVHLYAGFDGRWDVQLALRGADLSRARLGRSARLGLTSWIGRAAPRSAPAATRAGSNSAARAEAFADAPHSRADLRLRPDASFLLRPARRASTDPASGAPHG